MSGRHTGSSDIQLTPHGQAEARELGKRLDGLEFDAIFSSPMQRARRTAAIAGFANPTITPLLREFDYGVYEGVTTKEIHETRPGWEVFKDGCPGGETPGQVYARAGEFIELASSTGGRVLAFAHGHILRAVAVAWMGIEIAGARGLQLDVATLSVLRDGDHGRVLGMWNAP